MICSIPDEFAMRMIFFDEFYKDLWVFISLGNANIVDKCFDSYLGPISLYFKDQSYLRISLNVKNYPLVVPTTY